MKNIIAFGASNSSQSINQTFATWVANQLHDVNINILDINDYEMPIFSIDREKNSGIPKEAQQFKSLVANADGIIISFAEYNGSYSSAFKNIFDWISRLEKPIWSNKPMFLLATSPGPRGGQTVLGAALKSFPFQGGQVLANFSLPSFSTNFVSSQGIIDTDLKSEFQAQLEKFIEAIHQPA